MTESEGELLLEAARRGLSPSAADARRVRSAMVLSMSTDGTTTGAPPGRLAAFTAGAGGKLVVLAAVAGLSGITGYWLGVRASRTAPAASAAPSVPRPAVQPVPRVTQRDARAFASATEQPPQLPATPTRPTSRTAPPIDAAALDEELATVRRVERALRAGNPQLALSLLRDLDVSTPGGKLGEERRAAFAVASCEIGFGSSRQSLLDAFLKRYPSSVYRARVRASCAEPPEATDRTPSGDLGGMRSP